MGGVLFPAGLPLALLSVLCDFSTPLNHSNYGVEDKITWTGNIVYTGCGLSVLSLTYHRPSCSIVGQRGVEPLRISALPSEDNVAACYTIGPFACYGLIIPR